MSLLHKLKVLVINNTVATEVPYYLGCPSAGPMALKPLAPEGPTV